MEFDILNELLTDTVSKLFRRQEVRPQKPITSDSSNTSCSSISSTDQSPMIQKPLVTGAATTKAGMTLEVWINNIGPQKLAESLQRLNIDLNKLTKRDLEMMNVDALSNEKKRVKNELKAYDASFQQYFNRFPLRNEKEPMRPLYIYYKKLKQQIDKAPVVPIATTGNTQKRIDELKKLRFELRDKLNAFQNEFTQLHNRKIRFHKDIAPVEREYKQYKEIKLEIQKLEAMLK